MNSINLIYDKKSGNTYCYIDNTWVKVPEETFNENAIGNIKDRIEYLENIVQDIRYRKDIDFSENNDDDIDSVICVNKEYDFIDKSLKVFGDVKIKVPKKSDYYLNLKLRFFNSTKIYVGESFYTVKEDMTLSFDDVDEIRFSFSDYVWIKALTIQEYKKINIPTKVSDLDNDLEFISSSVEDENLLLKIGNNK